MNTAHRRVLCTALPAARGESIALGEEEGRHLTQVLRLEPGDEVEALDGRGSICRARLVRKGKVLWIEALEAPKRASVQGQVAPIVLELSILKGDAMEWAIEKSVELGVARLVPVITDHAVVKLDKKGPEAFLERWRKIADQALKQCGRLERLEIEAPTKVSQLTPSKHRVWMDEAARDSTPIAAWLAQNSAPEPVRLLIGPEGGWSETERRLLAQTPTASLGPLILRAETAALFAVSVARGMLDNNAQKK